MRIFIIQLLLIISRCSDEVRLSKVDSLIFSSFHSTIPHNGLRKIQAEYIQVDPSIPNSPLSTITCYNQKNRKHFNGSWLCASAEMPVGMEFGFAEVHCENPKKKYSDNDPYVYKDSCWLTYSLKLSPNQRYATTSTSSSGGSSYTSSSAYSSYSSSSSHSNPLQSHPQHNNQKYQHPRSTKNMLTNELSISNGNVKTAFLKNSNGEKEYFLTEIPLKQKNHLLFHLFDSNGEIVLSLSKMDSRVLSFYSSSTPLGSMAQSQTNSDEYIFYTPEAKAFAKAVFTSKTTIDIVQLSTNEVITSLKRSSHSSRSGIFSGLFPSPFARTESTWSIESYKMDVMDPRLVALFAAAFDTSKGGFTLEL
ncbi:uncharacterized protein MONOS_4176 [Monocercomonoides exilis]|uniref:uncharacterized protein n=1 Tax=Monocercomonoides exilis TaxID=2049356 RepID=UPI003559D216|nr:hypothetical protein MONOS_4176 [Monocercomonoides exilis]|eukprot:MONOS_4176.1-p1 / transcript=MONOS_4176.1 / gene=MONOS_4176 / organism=Monocercomonoides_exilis_PA203 / gene_product=unspecified product / transcript_product=unspecified product / location=Mono_scaffold00107:56711-58128(+) / protein_length=362 / sequence_SO=supercontig / SO=protein_coding / is_pseudo=false